MGKKTFLFGAAIGAAAMYLLDPENGDQRRSMAQRRAEEIADTPMAQKVVGQAMEATRGLHDAGPEDGTTLVDRVRSEVMGRDEFSGLALNIDAHDGTVSLRGVVDDAVTRRRLVEAIHGVPGVKMVDSYLHATGESSPEMSTTT